MENSEEVVTVPCEYIDNTFIIRVWGTETDGYSINKTWEEIYKALCAEKIIIARKKVLSPSYSQEGNHLIVTRELRLDHSAYAPDEALLQFYNDNNSFRINYTNGTMTFSGRV